jgi:hypothetical protein
VDSRGVVESEGAVYTVCVFCASCGGLTMSVEDDESMLDGEGG